MTYKLMTACILLLAPLSAKAPNMDHNIYHKPAKHHTTQQQTSDQDDATYETKAKEPKKIGAMLYMADNTSEYAQVSYQISEHSRIAIGSSIFDPNNFHYGLVEFQGNRPAIGQLHPVIQLGYGSYQGQDAQKQGLLTGFSLNYKLNRSTAIDLNIKHINDTHKIGHKGVTIASIGFELKG